jgi:homoserine O-acetyltransferase
MKHKTYLLLICLNILNFSQSIDSYYPLQRIAIGDFVTENNDTIKNCSLTYRVFGKANNDSTNIIFFPTWLAGNSENIGTLLSKYSFLDTNKFCIISIDALGNGFSSSPSNSLNFPEISFGDLTRAYYIGLNYHLGIKRLFAIVGGSMGGMTAFHFAVLYPDYADKIVSYVSSPKLTTYDLLWINTQITLVERLTFSNIPKSDIKALSDMITAMIARTPAYINKSIPTSDFYSYFQKFFKLPDSVYTLENYLAQLKAVRNYDITKKFDNNLEIAAKNVKSRLLVIVSENDMMVNPENAIRFAELTNSKLFILKNDCGHLAVNCEIEKVREIIRAFLEQ